MPEVRLTAAAQRDIKTIINFSRDQFGQDAADRYQALIKRSVRDIGDDPERPGSKQRSDIMIESARTYHLVFSRTRVRGPRVATPRHFLLYRRRNTPCRGRPYPA